MKEIITLGKISLLLLFPLILFFSCFFQSIISNNLFNNDDSPNFKEYVNTLYFVDILSLIFCGIPASITRYRAKNQIKNKNEKKITIHCLLCSLLYISALTVNFWFYFYRKRNKKYRQ